MTSLIQVTLVFPRLQAHAEPVPIIQVATACCSCSHPEFNLSELNPSPWSQQEYFSKWFASAVTRCRISVAHIRSHGCHHSNIIFTFTAYYSYQKDERVRPGNLLKKKPHSSSSKQSVRNFSLAFHFLPFFYICLLAEACLPAPHIRSCRLHPSYLPKRMQILIIFAVFCGAIAQTRASAASLLRSLDYTHTHDRTPLNGWSARHTGRYLPSYLKNERPTWYHLLFYFTYYVLNMFRALI